MIRAAFLTLCLTLGVALLWSLQPPVLGQDGDLERARELVDAARPYNRKSGDPNLDHGERKAARKEAYTRLKEARRLYDAYLDAHPSEEEALDAEYVEANSMLYWIKKMAAVNEFDDARGPVALPPPKKAAGPIAVPKSGPTARPKPPGPGDEPGEQPEEGPEDVAEEPVAPVESAEEARARLARETFEAIQEIERDSPGDVGHLHDLYVKFLAEYDDPALPEYTKAAMRLGALADRLKTVFKKEVGQDPDAVAEGDERDMKVIVTRLSRAIKSRDVEERRRAAELLGNMGSGEASYPLVRALRDDDGEVATLAADGLVRLGGTRTCYNLTKSYRDSNHDSQVAALDVLVKIAGASEVDGRTASTSIGRFALSQDDEVAASAMTQLMTMGATGGPGLVEALATRQLPKRLRAIQAIGAVKYYAGAKPIAMYLLRGDGQKTVAQRTAAIAALESMGLPVVGDLIDMLKSSKHKGWTAVVLRNITGQQLGMKDAAKWRKWWNANKPEGAE